MRIAKVQTEDRNINQLQQNISQVVEPMSNVVFSAGQIAGIPQATSATAGNFGEYVSASPSAVVTVTATATVQNVTRITLQPGDWRVEGTVGVNQSAPTGWTRARFAISTSSAALDSSASGGIVIIHPAQSAVLYVPTGSRRILISSITVIYLVAEMIFTGGTFSYDTNSLLQAWRTR